MIVNIGSAKNKHDSARYLFLKPAYLQPQNYKIGPGTSVLPPKHGCTDFNTCL